MKIEKYLIYIDILGFKKLPQEIAQMKGIDQRDVRKHLIDIINDRIINLETNGRINGKKYGESDDWIFVAETLDDAIVSIFDILDHDTGYKDFKEIPLEIAIGKGYFDDNAKLVGASLTCEDPTIDFLNTKIINYYRGWFKINYNSSPKSTFIIITQDVYNDLSATDKKASNKINRKNDDGSEIILFSINVEHFIEKGKILKFLELIGSKRFEYKEMNVLYINPNGFNDIIKILNENNIVIIVGDPEVGKTYTSIKLLYDYYKEGLKPVIVSEEKVLSNYGEGTLELDGKAIYFEDPWGKINLNIPETDLRFIGNLILRAKFYNTKIIISSREKVFDEFNKRKETSENLWRLVNNLKIGFSYDKKSLKLMIQRYIEVVEPAWQSSNCLRELVLNSIGKQLHTPMAIRQFVESTRETTDFTDVIKGLEKASEETRLTFSREIKELFRKKAYGEIVLLSLAYVEIPIKLAPTLYENIILSLNKLGYDLIQDTGFDNVLNQYQNMELEIVSESIRFLHPSYKEAFSRSLTDNGLPNSISKNLFSNVLFKLIEENVSIENIDGILAINFFDIPESFRNELIIELSKKIKIRPLLYRIAANYDRLPKEIKDLLIYNYDDTDSSIFRANAIIDNYDHLPENARKVLHCMAENENTAPAVAVAITESCDRFPKLAKEILSSMIKSKNLKIALSTTIAIVSIYNKLSPYIRDILHLITDNEDSAFIALGPIAYYYSDLPDSLRQIIQLMAKNERTAKIFANSIAVNFQLYPEDIRKIFFSMAENKKTAFYIAESIAKNYNSLPEDVQGILFSMANEKSFAMHVAAAIAFNYNDLSSEAKKILHCLIENDKTAEETAAVILVRYDNLPEEVRNLLNSWAYNEKTASMAAYDLTRYYDDLPEGVRKILYNMAENEKTAQYVASAITKNYNYLPQNVIEILKSIIHSS